MEETIGGHLLSDVMLDLYNGCHPRWLTTPSIWRLTQTVWCLLQASILNGGAMVVNFEIFGNGYHSRWLSRWPTSVQVKDWPKLSVTWCLLQVFIFNHRSMLVIFEILAMATIQNGWTSDKRWPSTVSSIQTEVLKFSFRYM